MKYLILLCSILFICCGASNYEIAKSENCKYDTELNVVIEIPGQKLDIQTCRSKEFQSWLKNAPKAKLSKPEIKEIESYIKSRSRSEFQWHAVEKGDFYLIFVHEHKVADGGFEFVFEKSKKKVVGSFLIGYRG